MKKRIRRTLAACAIALANPAGAQDSHLLIVAGLGGEPQYADAFRSWSSALHAAAEKSMGVPRANLIYLTESPEKDPARVDARATKAEIEKALARIAARVRPGDTLAVILFGHGSGAGDEARFNLPGPDVTARDFATWLVPFANQRVVFVNAASASGDFQKSLAGRNRVILTSTKSSQERNESVFGRYFSEALAGSVADVDKNGRVSVLEAFEAAKAQVAAEYQRERRLQTEHAVLEDGQNGSLARSTFIGGSTVDIAESAAADPALAALERERRTIEDRIETLKASKASMPAEKYESDLEDLLVELALKTEEIRKKKGGGR